MKNEAPNRTRLLRTIAKHRDSAVSNAAALATAHWHRNTGRDCPWPDGTAPALAYEQQWNTINAHTTPKRS